MSTLYPEKIASYFASISPLSAKIIADIQCVEDAVKIDSSLSYKEKSRIIDKHLIYDVIRRHKERHHKESVGEDEDVVVNEVYYDDPDLDQDHESALLTSVYPKRPEKYVYDDNSFYVDEHSEPFSYCSQSQTQYCDLEKLVKALPAPPTLARKSDSKSRPQQHHHHHHHHNKKPVPLPTQRLSEELTQEIPPPITTEPTKVEKKSTKKAGIAAFGVPLMGLSVGAKSDKKRSAPAPAPSQSSPESSLPAQVPNSDLIAELQAKLKMNKEKGTGNGLKRTSSKLSKPKAPPPPPPKIQTEVKVSDKETQKVVPVQSIIPEVHSTGPKKNPVEEVGKPGEEFCVDISSPCRIVSAIYNKVDISPNDNKKKYSTFIIVGTELTPSKFSQVISLT